jgi:hypothetical protein
MKYVLFHLTKDNFTPSEMNCVQWLETSDLDFAWGAAQWYWQQQQSLLTYKS